MGREDWLEPTDGQLAVDESEGSGSDRELTTESGTRDSFAAGTRTPYLPQPGDVVGDRFRIRASLGAGGMGHVFRAEHVALHRTFALKVLSPQLAMAGPGQAKRFLREARAVSLLKHPGIVEITDFGETSEGLPFFAMEYLDGEDLGARLDALGFVSRHVARDWMRQILYALEEAHRHGVVHRDLKPENCFLARVDDTERVKIVDFGIAKLLYEQDATRLTGDGHLIGTPHYMSPEQAVGKPIDARSDLYTCGVMLFELLTGQLPFDGGPAMAILSQHITQPPQTLAEAAPDRTFPQRLEALIARALAKDPADRFQSAAEFRQALETYDAAPALQPWHVGALAGVLGFGVVVSVGALVASSDEEPARSDEVARAEPTDASAETGMRPDAAPPPDVEASVVPTPPPTAAPPLVVPTPPPEDEADTEPLPEFSIDIVIDDDDASPTRRRARENRQPPAVEVTAPSNAAMLRALEAAAATCTRYARGELELNVRTFAAPSGALSGTTIAAPYATTPLGRCVARAIDRTHVRASKLGREFKHRVRVGE